MRCLAAIACLCVLVSMAAACASTPASRFYTLSAAATPSAAPSNLSVAVGPVSVPAVVDRPQIVVRTGPHEVRLDEFNRWAAPLQNTIARVVAENLVALLGTPRVVLAPPALETDTDYRVLIQVQRFESALGEAATLDAVWVVNGSAEKTPQTGRTTVRESAPDKTFEALAAAHSKALVRLSQDIAGGVQAMGR